MAKSNVLTRSKKQKAFRLMEQNQLAEAKPLLEKICSMDRSDAEAWYALGIINGTFDKHADAEKCFQQVVNLYPNNENALCNLGTALEKQGKSNEAAVHFKRALVINPDDFVILSNLASSLLSLENYRESIIYFKRALELDPRSEEVYSNLGLAYLETGNLEEAIKCQEIAIKINPNRPESYNNLSLTYSSLNQYDLAIDIAKQAIHLNPNFHEAYNNLAIALKRKGQLNKAIINFKKAIKLKQDYFKALNNLADTYHLQGRVSQSITSLKQIVKTWPDYEPALSNLLFIMNYENNVDIRTIYQEHIHWSEIHALSVSPLNHGEIDKDPKRKLRIGYVSPDFRSHSVAFFIEPVLAHHDSGQFMVFCYANVKRPDATTERLQSLADHWRSIVGMPDSDVAKLIQQDKIDILVDLAGHTGENRLLVFARKPAPVQVTYLGYPNTTGLTAMDYRLTDPWADPDGQEQYHSETLIRLPHGFLCYQPPAKAPAVAPLPAESTGHITFGSFNNLAKITPEVVALWAEILKGVPGSRLIIKNKSLRDSPTCDRYGALFEAEGIPHDRLELIGFLPKRDDHLGLYSSIDIALDTFPYNGTTTTCEALWMGVPVVTLTGDRHAGRVGTSLLTGLGLKDLIADSTAAYRDLAVTLAADFERLAQQRGALRQQMQTSRLCDGRAFTHELEAAYRHMWQQWCKQTTG